MPKIAAKLQPDPMKTEVLPIFGSKIFKFRGPKSKFYSFKFWPFSRTGYIPNIFFIQAKLREEIDFEISKF